MNSGNRPYYSAKPANGKDRKQFSFHREQYAGQDGVIRLPGDIVEMKKKEKCEKIRR